MVIAIPRQKLPNVMVGFKSEDKYQAFRVKKQFGENRNYIACARSSRKVCFAFFCIHCDDSMEVANHDLKFGYVFFCRILFVKSGLTRISRHGAVSH